MTKQIDEILKKLKDLPRKTVNGCWYIELGSIVTSMDQLLKAKRTKIIEIIEIQMNEIVAGKKLLQREKLLTDLNNANIKGQLESLYYLIKQLKL